MIYEAVFLMGTKKNVRHRHLLSLSHTHTGCFRVVCRLSKAVMIFILYKLYILSSYTHNFLCSYIFKIGMIYEAVFLMGTKKCPHKDKDFGYSHLCENILSP